LGAITHSIQNDMHQKPDYDYIIIGSGFGGSVSALRLAQKGYKVLVIEKGKWFDKTDFPKNNWHLKRWFWLPALRFFGIFKMSFLRHITVMSGTGVGGGSLVYAATLPRPEEQFFNSGNWGNLAKWEDELETHYTTAEKMLGCTLTTVFKDSDIALKKLASQMGRESYYKATPVGIYFKRPGLEDKDPYFDGDGPEREPCTFCGACMTGCRYNAKNTLDKNYLWLAQKNGAEIWAEKEVIDVIPIEASDGSNGYTVTIRDSTRLIKKKKNVTCTGIIFAAGVMGTVPLLLKLKKKSLPGLSNRVGEFVRTNNEKLVGIVSYDKTKNLSEGVSIGSILQSDHQTHIEPVRYGSGSGFWRLLMFPYAPGNHFFSRTHRVILQFIKSPLQWLKALTVNNFGSRSVVLMFMQQLDSTIAFKHSWLGMRSRVAQGRKPSVSIPGVDEPIQQYARNVNGKPFTMITESITGIPTTAHILGGCVMGDSKENGAINHKNEVFGYKNMLVCDGSMISANPGVNPSLTITAITERAMSLIPEKSKQV
jgi:cholesterol oxidase